MATHNDKGQRAAGISKYCITFGLSLAVLAWSGYMLDYAYQQHSALLSAGAHTGTSLERLGLLDQEGAKHEQR